MIRSRWLSFTFILTFAVSLAHAITPHKHSRSESSHKHISHHHHKNEKPEGHKSSELPVFVHFSNADFIGVAQLNCEGNEHLSVVAGFPVSTFQIQERGLTDEFLPTLNQGKPPDKPLVVVLSLRAPPSL